MKPTLYYTLFSPPSRSVLMVARYLNLDLDLKPLNFAKGEHLTEEFKRINPQHTVPTMVENGQTLWDSHAIIPYIVDKYAPSAKIYPQDLMKRAQISQRLHFSSGVLFPAAKTIISSVMHKKETELPQSGIDDCLKGCDLMESFLEKDYLTGSEMTIADFCCNTIVTSISFFANLDAQRHPRTIAWLARMSSLPGHDDINVKGAKQLHNMVMSGLKHNQKSRLAT